MIDLDATVLQRVIMPVVHDPDALPLYVDGDYWTSIPLYESRETKESLRGFIREESDRAVVRLSDTEGLSAIRGRFGFAVPHRRRISFGTYFNAFPASYWRRWTALTAVKLRVETVGTGQVLVSRSNARGVIQRVDSAEVSAPTVSEFVLDLRLFGDGGWYWFDLVAEKADFELIKAGWHEPDEDSTGRAGSVSLAITTLNRVEYCIDMLAAVAADSDVVAAIDRVWVIDQGTDKISASPGFDAVSAALGGRLTVIEQANLGGSGGFSRGMYETISAGESDYVLLLDDDVAVEPESIRRALRFADHTVEPTIVGGHMFDMYDKSKLHAFAEGFDTSNFMWGPLTPSRHDMATSNLRQTKWLHRRVDSQYNGWWMCLIPIPVIREIGLSLPVFIKWDDAEYALRAEEHGVHTVSLPGAAVWHVSWVDKDDSIDWQAFFHARNRLLVALLHSTKRRGGRLSRANLALDMKHLFAMQYFVAAARVEAYQSILAGPESLHADMRDRLPRTRELMSRYSDAAVVRDRNLVPEPKVDSAIEAGRQAPVYPPRGRATWIWLLHAMWSNVVRASRPASTAVPQAHLSFSDARWWVMGRFNSVLVTTADGTGTLWYRRNRREFLRLLWQTWRLRSKIRRQWPALSRAYRNALPGLVSADAWRSSFGIDDTSATL